MVPTFKHGGGSMMLWDCLTDSGSDLNKVNGIKKEHYLQNHQEILKSSDRRYRCVPTGI